MADMFGVGQAEVNLQDPLRRAQAQETLGRIAMQPAEIRGAFARAAEHEAIAAEKWEGIRQAQVLRRLGEAAMANGRVATVEDAQEVLEPKGPAEDLERMYELGKSQGMSAYDLMPIAKQIADLKKDDAVRANQRSNQEVHQLDAVKKRAERQGSLAMAALQGPQAYAALRLQTPELNHLPQTWEAARPFLENLVTSSISAQAQIDQQRKAARNEDLKRSTAATAAAATARAETARADADLKKQKFDNLKKNNGVADPSVVEARKATTKAKEVATEAARLKLAPMLPIKDQRVVGQIYTLPGGKRRVQWVQDPATGEVGAIPYEGQ